MNFLRITNIGNEHNQIITQKLDYFSSNESMQITLNFQFRMLRWRVSAILYDKDGNTKYQVNNLPLLFNRPLLYNHGAFEYDLICFTKNNLDPFDENDFTTGVASDQDYGLFIYKKTDLTSIYS